MCIASSTLKAFLPVLILSITLSHPIKKSSANLKDLIHDHDKFFRTDKTKPVNIHSESQKQTVIDSLLAKLKYSLDDPVVPSSELFGLMMPELFLPIKDAAGFIQDEELNDLPSSPPYNPSHHHHHHESMLGVSRPFTLEETLEAVIQNRRLRDLKKDNVPLPAAQQTLQRPYNKLDLLKPIKTQGNEQDSQKIETGTLQTDPAKINVSSGGSDSQEIASSLALMTDKAAQAYVETLKEHPSLPADITNLGPNNIDKIPTSLQALYKALEKTRATKTVGSEFRKKLYSAMLGLGNFGSTKNKDATPTESNITSVTSSFFTFPWTLGIFSAQSQLLNNTNNATSIDINQTQLDNIFQNFYKKIQHLMANGFSSSKNSTTTETQNTTLHLEETQKQPEHLSTSLNNNEPIILETQVNQESQSTQNDSNKVSQIPSNPSHPSSSVSSSNPLSATLPDATPLPAPDLETGNKVPSSPTAGLVVLKPILAAVTTSLDQYIAKEYPHLFKPAQEPATKNDSLSPSAILSLDLTTQDSGHKSPTKDTIKNITNSVSQPLPNPIEEPITQKHHSLSPLTILSINVTSETATIDNPPSNEAEDSAKNTTTPVNHPVLKPSKNHSKIAPQEILSLPLSNEDSNDIHNIDDLTKYTSSPVYPSVRKPSKNHLTILPQAILSIDLTFDESNETPSSEDAEEPITNKNHSLSPFTILSINVTSDEDTIDNSSTEDLTKNTQTPASNESDNFSQNKSSDTEKRKFPKAPVPINTLTNEEYIELLNDAFGAYNLNFSGIPFKPYAATFHKTKVSENATPELVPSTEKSNSSSENTFTLAIVESEETSSSNPSISDQNPSEDKPNPMTVKPSKVSSKKPRPEYGIPHVHHQHSKNITEPAPYQEPFLNMFNPFGLIPGWLIPSFKWPSFSKILQDILNRNKKNSDSSLRFGIENDCEDEVNETIEAINANGSKLLRHESLKVKSICQSDRTKSSSCSSFCAKNGFVSGSCIDEDSCNCHLSEDNTKFGLVFKRYSVENSTDFINTASSNSVGEEQCLKCSCSSNCQKSGAYIGYCGETCYCGVPWYDGSFTL